MSSNVLLDLGGWMSRLTRTSPLTNVYGVVRSVLAAGTLLTLLFTSPSALFQPVGGMAAGPYCTGASGLSIYCVMPSLGSARWLSILVLVAVLVGVKPRWTAIPHWYVAFSVQASASTVDGGDQVAAVLTLMILPMALCDGRRTHWQRVEVTDAPTEPMRLRRLLCWACVLAVQIQAAVLYFQAGVAKFGVREWADGTAMYYWLNDPSFGMPGWLHWLFDPILMHGFTLTLFTWSVAVGEMVLAFGLFAPRWIRRILLWCAVAFHLGIAVVMGLVSFAFSMVALDLLFLHAADGWLSLPSPVRTLLARVRSALGARLSTLRLPHRSTDTSAVVTRGSVEAR